MTDPNRSHAERAIEALRADIAAAAAFAINDASVRARYIQSVSQAANDILDAARRGRITWAEAALQAEQMRNMTLDLLRGRSSPIGLAMAQQMKAQGLNTNTLIARYTMKLFGNNAQWAQLTAPQRDQVYAAIVEAAGRSNPRVNAMMAKVGVAGRGLLVLSIGFSIYAIATSSDPGQTARREIAVTGAGVLGAAGAGALAGLACGPGAPVCVGLGAFIGGAAAAFGMSLFW